MDEPAARQPHILLMDGDAARAARRCGQLAQFGWAVTHALDEPDALRLARSGGTDVVLLQLPPGEAAGMDLPDALRRAAGGSYLLVVVLAEQPGEQVCCRLLEGGADGILPETIRPGELKARLQALLRIKDLQDQLDASRQALKEALARERELLRKLRADNAHLIELAATDPLTHLHNVRYFQGFLDGEFKIARRYGHALSLLALDLDHFKLVNDRFGHPAGDFVLKELGVILRRDVRESDVVARTGGEEFAIVLPRADRVQADQLARRIRREVAEHAFRFGATRIKVTCSIGMASYPQDADVTGPESLVYFADQALLAAKQSGRNCVVHWFEMDPARRARLRAQLSAAPDTQVV